MCGINGFTWEDEQLIREMGERIVHRGPDSDGTLVRDGVSLGFRRLAIIDLSPLGRQPMQDTSGDISIVFNGEIYNYQELRAEHCEGYAFRSKSDTEVILAMYAKHGTRCVEHFNGMWAFCIHDRKKGILFCSRDRLGQKPLHYMHDGKRFIFSSEIKAILASRPPTRIDPRAVASFLRYRYVLGEGTFFTGIKKLLPGHNLIFDLASGDARIEQYWDLPTGELAVEYPDARQEVERLLTRSVHYREISDVPTGSILSGGLDSSLITAIMAEHHDTPINTYTVRFLEKGFDETPFARMVAERYKTHHTEITITRDSYIHAMDAYLATKDEPIGVPNEVALALLFKEIKRTATVVLGGEGADELFAGYGRIFRSADEFAHQDTEKDFVRFFLDRYGYFTDTDMQQVLKEEIDADFTEEFRSVFGKCARDHATQVSYVFLKLHLPGLLLRLDAPSMSAGVEARAPFLDKDLIGYVFRLPFTYKNRYKDAASEERAAGLPAAEISEKLDIPKVMLKEIARAHIHEDIITRKKQGFPLPLETWFVDENDAKEELLEDGPLLSYCDRQKLKTWLDSVEGKGQRIWMLVSLKRWLERIQRDYPEVEL